jgi:hypothetical protein
VLWFATSSTFTNWVRSLVPNRIFRQEFGLLFWNFWDYRSDFTHRASENSKNQCLFRNDFSSSSKVAISSSSAIYLSQLAAFLLYQPQILLVQLTLYYFSSFF